MIIKELEEKTKVSVLNVYFSFTDTKHHPEITIEHWFEIGLTSFSSSFSWLSGCVAENGWKPTVLGVLSGS